MPTFNVRIEVAEPSSFKRRHDLAEHRRAEAKHRAEQAARDRALFILHDRVRAARAELRAVAFGMTKALGDLRRIQRPILAKK